MAQIPTGQKFHTVPSDVQTVERGSALANSQREIFTMQDIIDTVGGGGGGTNYTIVPADGTPIENGSAFKSAYSEAVASTPNGEGLGFYNQFYVLLSPGYYKFEEDLNLSDAWVNVVSLTGLRDVFIVGSYTLNVTAYAVYIQGIDTGSLPFTTSGTSSAQVIENCKGGNYSFGITGAYGTYINCAGGNYSFGGNAIAGGTFTNCNGGPLSFGGGYGGTQATGIFKNCSSGSESFGGFNGTASGTFDACSGGNNSFGGGILGDASGIFTFCSMTNGNFPIPTTGKFVYCHQNGTPYNAGFTPQNNL